jgi:hypothetical protein
LSACRVAVPCSMALKTSASISANSMAFT